VAGGGADAVEALGWQAMEDLLQYVVAQAIHPVVWWIEKNKKGMNRG
jgi:hypothetical protein